MEKIKTKSSLGLYVHIPFCLRKCFFCSFVVYIGKNNHKKKYLTCLEQELKEYSQKRIKTIYFGGGTPTFLNGDELTRLIKSVKANFLIEENCEFTIEANPDTIDFPKARLLKELGVNRVSIGAQTFSNRYLKFLGRTHQAKDVEKCFAALRKAGFDNITLDLMYGFPGQTLGELKDDIKKIIKFNSEHLSLYTLTVEPRSKFNIQNLKMPSTQRLGAFYTHITRALEKKGFAQYEISNFAKPGKQSEHNCIYWKCQDYIGLGAGAHSHFEGTRFWNTSSVPTYLRLAEKGKPTVDGKEKLNKDRRLLEALLFGLRMNEGVSLCILEKQFNAKFSKQTKEKISQFCKDEFLILKNSHLKTTLQGRLVLDELSVRLI
ncbi:MAG: radical SAM family heme chaperone HemW [Candidatus Aceula meridiana]|nr:radical SAM family heme chaperone HemW [Candidatus Aceula meridiana]